MLESRVKQRLARLGAHITSIVHHQRRRRSEHLLTTVEQQPSGASHDRQASAVEELVAHGFTPVRNHLVRKALCELSVQGYTVLPDMMDKYHLEQCRQRFEDLSAAEGRLGGIEVLPASRQEQLLEDISAEGPNPGIRRLGDLVNKGECFDGIWQNAILVSIVMGVLPGTFKLHSLNGHDPKPGHGQQALHADWGGPKSTAELVAAGIWSEEPDTIERPAHLFGVD